MTDTMASDAMTPDTHAGPSSATTSTSTLATARNSG